MEKGESSYFSRAANKKETDPKYMMLRALVDKQAKPNFIT